MEISNAPVREQLLASINTGINGIKNRFRLNRESKDGHDKGISMKDLNTPITRYSLLALSSLIISACGGAATEDDTSTQIDPVGELSITCDPNVSSMAMGFPGSSESLNCSATYWDDDSNTSQPVAPTDAQIASGLGVIQYSITNPNLASVDEYGTVTPLNTGNTQINMSISYDGEVATHAIALSIEAATPPMVVECDTTTLEMYYPGSSEQISCSPKLLNESTGQYDLFTPSDIEISSGQFSEAYVVANQGVATASTTGIVTPAGVGTSSLQVSMTYDNYTATQNISIQVEAFDENYLLSCAKTRIVLLSNNFDTNPKYERIQCSVLEKNEDTSEYELFIPSEDEKTMSYSSADESIATVDEEGKITAINTGETSVTVSYSVEDNSLTQNIAIISGFSDISELAAKPSSLWVGVGTTKRIDVSSLDSDGNQTSNTECEIEAHFNSNVSVELNQSLSTNGAYVFDVTGISKGYTITSKHSKGGYFSCAGSDGAQSQIVQIQVKDPVDIPNPSGINTLGKNPDVAIVEDRVFITSFSEDEEKLVFTKISGTVNSETINVTNADESGIKSSILLDESNKSVSLLTISDRDNYAMLDEIGFINQGDYNTGAHSTDTMDSLLSNYYSSYDGRAVLSSDHMANRTDNYTYIAIVSATDNGLKLYEQDDGQSYPRETGLIYEDVDILDAAVTTIKDCGAQRLAVAICSNSDGLIYGIEAEDGSRIDYYDLESDCTNVDIASGNTKQVSIITQTGSRSSGEELIHFKLNEESIVSRVVDNLTNGQEFLDFDLEIKDDKPRILAMTNGSSGKHLYHYTNYESFNNDGSEWTQDEIDTGFDLGESLAMTVTEEQSHIVVEGSAGILKYMTQPTFITYDQDEAELSRQTCAGIIPTRKTLLSSHSFE